jgi:hypothetical protein
MHLFILISDLFLHPFRKTTYRSSKRNNFTTMSDSEKEMSKSDIEREAIVQEQTEDFWKEEIERNTEILTTFVKRVANNCNDSRRSDLIDGIEKQIESESESDPEWSDSSDSDDDCYRKRKREPEEPVINPKYDDIRPYKRQSLVVTKKILNAAEQIKVMLEEREEHMDSECPSDDWIEEWGIEEVRAWTTRLVNYCKFNKIPLPTDRECQ